MLGGIITVRGAALLMPLVTRVRVTVTGLVMAARMTATGAAEEIWCVALITARSLVTTIMKRTIAARNHDQI